MAIQSIYNHRIHGKLGLQLSFRWVFKEKIKTEQTNKCQNVMTRKSTASANHFHIFTGMYSSIAHSCTNNTIVAGYHDSRTNTDTPYRSLWRYICSSSCARAGVFPGIPVYRFALFTGSFVLATTGR